MGLPMAANLRIAGNEIRGYDLSAARRAASAAAGIELAGSSAAAADRADTLITMLSDGASVLATWREAIPNLRPDALLIDCSTIGVASAREAHALACAGGLLSLDAPVSGGTEGATAATLTFMIGGELNAVARGEPLLSRMGRRSVHCGSAGSGQAAKLCNNMILGISMIGVSEAFNLAARLGLSSQALFDVASTSSGNCYALTTHCPVPGPVPSSAANRGYTPGFAAELMAKDLRLSQEAASAVAVSTPLGAAAAALFARFSEGKGRGRDYSGIITMLEKETR
jgi:3-hydroxyisobutyrate dehydrogenase